MRPTLKHRPILKLGLFGTVYGISPEGEVKYFDYKWEDALDFAGVDAETVRDFEDIDLRYSIPKNGDYYLPGHDMWNPERRIDRYQRVWWVADGQKNF